MGRGRQKAKQQKIARKLKYLTTDTDYDELAKELGARRSPVRVLSIRLPISKPSMLNDADAEHESADDDAVVFRSLPMISTSTPSGPPKPRRRRPVAKCRP